MTGAAPLYIAPGDVVELWLKEGEHGWEPALGGWTVRHLSYAQKRNEPIPEPFWHMAERRVEAAWRHYSGIIVFGGIALFLLVFVLLVKFQNH